MKTFCLLALYALPSYGINHTPGLEVARRAMPKIQLLDQVKEGPQGTEVGKRGAQLHDILLDLQKDTFATTQRLQALYDQVINLATTYHRTLGDMRARLQVGTTPVHPSLVAQQNKAEDVLAEINEAIHVMDKESKDLHDSSQKIETFLRDVELSFQMPGAVEEDHAHLLLLEDSALRLKNALKRTFQVVDVNKDRQIQWLNDEKNHFAELKEDVQRGRSQKETSAPSLITPQALPPLPVVPHKVPTPHQIITKTTKKKPHSLKHPSSHPKNPKKTIEAKKELGAEEPLKKVEVKEHPVKIQKEETPFLKKEEANLTEPMPKSTEVPQEQPQGVKVPTDRKPLAIVNFNREDVAYKWYILAAVNRALDESPQSTFEIHAVGKNLSEAKEKGETILKSLMDQGLEAKRFSVHSTVQPQEPHTKVMIFKKDV